MKKSHYFLVVLLVFLVLIAYVTGCFLELKHGQKTSDIETLSEDIPANATIVKQEQLQDMLTAGYISKIKFDNHTYIVFSRNGVGITHDPDCECHNAILQNNEEQNLAH